MSAHLRSGKAQSNHSDSPSLAGAKPAGGASRDRGLAGPCRYSFSLLRRGGLAGFFRLKPGGFWGQRVFYGWLGVCRLIVADTWRDISGRVKGGAA